jgi:hypothetical protein
VGDDHAVKVHVLISPKQGNRRQSKHLLCKQAIFREIRGRIFRIEVMLQRLRQKLVWVIVALLAATVTLWALTEARPLEAESSFGSVTIRAQSAEQRATFSIIRHSVPDLLGWQNWHGSGWLYRGQLSNNSTITVLVIPFWLPVSLLSLLLMAEYFLRQKKKTPSGHCPVCGYDLRASPLRCPECGTARPAPC